MNRQEGQNTEEGVAVSVVIPTFNRGHRIVRAVESVLASDGDVVGEVIVVDDGSSDGSCANLEQIDNRVRLVTIGNQGAAKARLVGVENASCDFVSFLDSDDTSCDGRVKYLLEALLDSPGCIASFGTITDSPGGLRGIAEELPGLSAQSNVYEGSFGKLLRNGCFVPSMNLCTRKVVALRAARTQGFFPSANDYDFVLGIAQQGDFAFCSKAKICCERLADGISLSNKDTQMCYALLAGDFRLRQCGSDARRWKADFRFRVVQRWPPALVRSWRAGRYGMAAKVAAIGIRYGLASSNLKQLYWSWDHARRTRGTDSVQRMVDGSAVVDRSSIHESQS
ncbi:glycosyltransferase family 2 protein [Stieleria sp. JC731]|uniref:glycosyltransferase family 2 protein n=1 Tax=Pirellulaceae TaxID=2691357 RepID=UPI001E28DF7B|nr:glycosyltransferase family 2 protein [Stieleria sp. JC731]MCC9601452.1 glycosyltransferase family 2 protein [Stieleria sp. JC731]